MRLLLVFPFIPYPPNDGGRIGFFNPIKYLSRDHEIAVVSLASAEEHAAAEALRNVCPELHVFPRSAKADVFRLARGLVSFPPGASARYWCRPAGDFIGQVVSSYRPDIVEFHHLNTAAYRQYVGGLPAILREHNVEYKVWERHAETATGLQKAFAAWTAPRVRRYEGECAAQLDRCVVVSEADAAYLREASPSAKIEVVPSGVDTEYFYPSSQSQEDPYRMVLTGSFEWKPKQHNLRVLLTEIMPRIRAKAPKATLYVVGKGVPEDLRRLGERTPGVTVTGAVPDVRPYVWQASVVLNYLESGGGIALKVLEAMAMRKPVLSNSRGCEGIDVHHGRDVFLADGSEAFADAAVYLLGNAGLRASLAHFGQSTVQASYSWTVIAAQLRRCYEAVLARRSGSYNRETRLGTTAAAD